MCGGQNNHKAPHYAIFSSLPLLPPFQPNCLPQHPTPGCPLPMPESRSNPGKTDPGIRSPCKNSKKVPLHMKHLLLLYSDYSGRSQLKCDGARAETRFRLSAKRTSPFKSAGASVQSTTGSRVLRISGSNAGYTMFRGSVKGTGYLIHLPVSLSLPLPCVTLCHHI